MKNIKMLLCVALVIFAISDISSQTENKNGSSKAEMTIPNYPALNIIGSQTSEITKPGDFSALQASVISPLVTNDGTIPSNLAIEFTPYYFKSNQRTLTGYLSALENDKKKLIWRNSKFSIASNNVVGTDSSLYSRVGLGYRTMLKEATLKSKAYPSNNPQRISGIEAIKDALKANVTVDKNLVQKEFNTTWEGYDRVLTTSTSTALTKEEKIQKLKEIQDEIAKNPEAWVAPEVYDFNLRKGLFIEWAIATSFDFEDRNIANPATFQRWGTWFNFTYMFDDEKVDPTTKKKSKKQFYIKDLTLMLRGSNYSLDPTVIFDRSGTFIDGGLNVQLGLAKKLDLTAEYIYRYSANDFTMLSGENKVNVASGTQESKLSATLVLHVTDNVSTTFSYSLVNGDQSYSPESLQMLLLGLTAAILPLK